jgi:hypothetical protein
MYAPGEGTMSSVLQFERDAAPTSHLIALDGGAADRGARLSLASLRTSLPAVLVLLATAFAVVADVVDTTPMWSPVAVAVSAAVLAMHRLLIRFRAA